MLTIVIVGTGVLAILSAQQAFHRQNDWAQKGSTAMLLANELRELTLSLPLSDPITGSSNVGVEAGESSIADYDDVDDFAGAVDEFGFGAGMTIDPPINALRLPIDGMDGWSQFVEVASVLPTNISAEATQPLGTTSMMRVRVTVFYQPSQSTPAQSMGQLTWVVGE